MSRPKNHIEKLGALLDAIEENILQASDEEIIEEKKASGEDPEAAARHVQSIIQSGIKKQRQKKLRAAREGYNQAIVRQQRRTPMLPDDPVERRALLDAVLASKQSVPRGITMAFREGKHMSDDDVTSILEDLIELGILSDEEEGGS